MTSNRFLASSNLLRAIILEKRRDGLLNDALMLARFGVEAKSASGVSDDDGADSISRIALARYLEQCPDDIVVRDALNSLDAQETQTPDPEFVDKAVVEIPPPPGQVSSILRGIGILFGLFIAFVAVTGWAFYSNLPLDAPMLPREEPLVSEAAVSVPVPQSDPAPSVSLPGERAVEGSVVKEVVTEQPVDTPLVLRAVGDIVMGTDFPQPRMPDEKDLARLEALAHNFEDADIVVGNLESVLAGDIPPRKDVSQPNQYAFKMPRRYAKVLRKIGFDVLNVANNHSMDFGQSGLKSTISALRKAQISPVGAPGVEMSIVEVRGIHIAFLSYSYLSHFAYMGDEARIRREIAQARAVAPIVVVNVHAGKEGRGAGGPPSGPEYYLDEFRGDLKVFAHLAIDAGASVILGHGPHLLRSVEMYRDRPIFYSLGNFIGYRTLSSKGRLSHSVIAEVRFDSAGAVTGVGVIPLKIDGRGIPAPDYSGQTLAGLNGMLDQKVGAAPVLDISFPAPTTEQTKVGALLNKNPGSAQ